MSTHDQRRRGRRGDPAPRAMAGVTLIELIMTLAIATVLLTIAVPSFQSVMRTNRIATLTNELSTALQLARSEAIKRGKTVTVCESDDVLDYEPTCNPKAGDDWQSGWVVFVDDNKNGSFNSGELVLRVGQPAVSNATITGDAHFANYVHFLPTGVSNTNGTLYICVADNERRIILNIIGRLKVCNPKDPAFCNLPAIDNCVCTNPSPCP